MKKRFVKTMSMMLAAAMLITGFGFSNVTTVKAEHVYDEDIDTDIDVDVNIDEDTNGNDFNNIKHECSGYYFGMKYAHTLSDKKSKINEKEWYKQKSSKVDFINNKSKQFAISVYINVNGKPKFVQPEEYKVKVKKLSVNKNGYGKYEVIVTLNDKIDNNYYTVTDNKVMKKVITVVPNIEAIDGEAMVSGCWNEKKSKANWKTTHEYYVRMWTNHLFKGVDGVEVVVSPKKDGKNNILHFKSECRKDKGYTKYDKIHNCYGTKKTWVWSRKTFYNKKLYDYYVSVRLYSIVDGKKLYSDWLVEATTVKNNTAITNSYITTKLNGGKRYNKLKVSKYYSEANGEYY